MPKFLWYGDGPPVRLKDLVDGDSDTIGVVYAGTENSVIWTKPDALVLNEVTLVDIFFGSTQEAWVGFMDIETRQLLRTIDADQLNATLTHQGHESNYSGKYSEGYAGSNDLRS